METTNGTSPQFLRTEGERVIFSVYKGWEDGEVEVTIPRNCSLKKIKGTGSPHFCGECEIIKISSAELRQREFWEQFNLLKRIKDQTTLRRRVEDLIRKNPITLWKAAAALEEQIKTDDLI